MPRIPVRPVELVAFSTEQAANASGLRQERIAAAVRNGELRAVRVGVKTKILRSDLEAWLLSHPSPTKGVSHVAA